MADKTMSRVNIVFAGTPTSSGTAGPAPASVLRGVVGAGSERKGRDRSSTGGGNHLPQPLLPPIEITSLEVKGADYRKSEVVGAEFVESYGGRVHLAELRNGFSTTNILERMKAKFSVFGWQPRGGREPHH